MSAGKAVSGNAELPISSRLDNAAWDYFSGLGERVSGANEQLRNAFRGPEGLRMRRAGVTAVVMHILGRGGWIHETSMDV